MTVRAVEPGRLFAGFVGPLQEVQVGSVMLFCDKLTAPRPLRDYHIYLAEEDRLSSLSTREERTCLASAEKRMLAAAGVSPSLRGPRGKPWHESQSPSWRASQRPSWSRARRRSCRRRRSRALVEVPEAPHNPELVPELLRPVPLVVLEEVGSDFSNSTRRPIWRL